MFFKYSLYIWWAIVCLMVLILEISNLIDWTDGNEKLRLLLNQASKDKPVKPTLKVNGKGKRVTGKR